jgi:hypothetical protein
LALYLIHFAKQFGTEKFKPLEILDWYHLKDNLYKIGGSLKGLQAVESLLWQGQIEPIQALFKNCRGTQVKMFFEISQKHRTRIINYSYYQANCVLLVLDLSNLLLNRLEQGLTFLAHSEMLKVSTKSLPFVVLISMVCLLFESFYQNSMLPVAARMYGIKYCLSISTISR